MTMFSALFAASEIPTANSSGPLKDDNFFDIDVHGPVPTVVFPESSKTNGNGILSFTLPKFTGKAYDVSKFNLCHLRYNNKGNYTPHQTVTDSFLIHCMYLMWCTISNNIDCLWLNGDLISKNLNLDGMEKSAAEGQLRKWVSLMPSPAVAELDNGPGDLEKFFYYWEETQKKKYTEKDVKKKN